MHLLPALLALAAVVAVAHAGEIDDVSSLSLGQMMQKYKDIVVKAKDNWPAFKKQFGKGDKNDAPRQTEFIRNSVRVALQNKAFEEGKTTHQAAINQFCDMTASEYEALLGVLDTPLDLSNITEAVTKEGRAKRAPVSVDWRATMVTPVKNQGTCGSCYAFSSAAVIESRLRYVYGQTYDLSEQQLMDCTYNRYANNMNQGCTGGDPQTTLQHAINYGIQQEYYYPYAGQLRTCSATSGQISLANWKVYYVQNNEVAMRDAVATYGPIAVTINASPNSFMTYKSGIYNDAACGTTLNHAVVLVGYGNSNGWDYWIIKNSWGSSWGQAGYMYLVRGYNRCGIVTKYGYFVQ